MHNTTKIALGITAILVFFVGGCKNGYTSPYGGSVAPTTKPSPNTVAITNFAFVPETLTIVKGTIVSWQNNDAVAHTSTSDNGAWDTGNIIPGATKTTMFNTAGTFAYHCTVHPMMTGTVVVQ